MFAHGEQIPHLQTEKYFLPGTRPGKKWIAFDLPPAGGKLCEAFGTSCIPRREIPPGAFLRCGDKKLSAREKNMFPGYCLFFTFYYNKFKKRPLPVCQWLLTDF
ncbi:MAG: hypothetical protein ACLR5H_08495 [Oscillospiraceae bacterium]